jgi:hypothetical protein
MIDDIVGEAAAVGVLGERGSVEPEHVGQEPIGVDGGHRLLEIEHETASRTLAQRVGCEFEWRRRAIVAAAAARSRVRTV